MMLCQDFHCFGHSTVIPSPCWCDNRSSRRPPAGAVFWLCTSERVLQFSSERNAFLDPATARWLALGAREWEPVSSPVLPEPATVQESQLGCWDRKRVVTCLTSPGRERSSHASLVFPNEGFRDIQFFLSGYSPLLSHSCSVAVA